MFREPFAIIAHIFCPISITCKVLVHEYNEIVCTILTLLFGLLVLFQELVIGQKCYVLLLPTRASQTDYIGDIYSVYVLAKYTLTAAYIHNMTPVGGILAD